MLRLLGLLEVAGMGVSAWLYRLPTPYHQILSGEAIARCRENFLEGEERRWWPKIVEYLATGPKSLSAISSRVYGSGLPESAALGLLICCKNILRVGAPPAGHLDPGWADSVMFGLNPTALTPGYQPAGNHPHDGHHDPHAEQFANITIQDAAHPRWEYLREIENGEPDAGSEVGPLDEVAPVPPQQDVEVERGEPIDADDYDPDTCDPEDRPVECFDIHAELRALGEWPPIYSDDTPETDLDPDDDHACMVVSDFFNDILIARSMR